MSLSVYLNILKVKQIRFVCVCVYLLFIDFTLCPWQSEGSCGFILLSAAANMISLGKAKRTILLRLGSRKFDSS